MVRIYFAMLISREGRALQGMLEYLVLPFCMQVIFNLERRVIVMVILKGFKSEWKLLGFMESRIVSSKWSSQNGIPR